MAHGRSELALDCELNTRTSLYKFLGAYLLLTLHSFIIHRLGKKTKNQNRNPNPNTREETWKKREGQEKKEGAFYPKIYTLYITTNTGEQFKVVKSAS